MIYDTQFPRETWPTEVKVGILWTVSMVGRVRSPSVTYFVISVGQPTLDKESSEHAIMIYCLKATQELAQLLDLDAPSFILPDSASSVTLTTVIKKLTRAHRQHYFDGSRGVFVSGPDRQVSWAANAWAVLAGVPESREVAAKAMQETYAMEDAITGMTPYLHHYVSMPAEP